MYIEYIILGLISLATLIWAFSTLPEDDASPDDDDDGGTNVGGDSYPTGTPPTIDEGVPDENEESTLDVSASPQT